MSGDRFYWIVKKSKRLIYEDASYPPQLIELLKKNFSRLNPSVSTDQASTIIVVGQHNEPVIAKEVREKIQQSGVTGGRSRESKDKDPKEALVARKGFIFTPERSNRTRGPLDNVDKKRPLD